MRRFRVFLSRLLAFFQRERWEEELDAELKSNLELHIDDNVRHGMTPEAARRAALIRFGCLTAAKDRYRERKIVPSLEDLLQDLRLAFRIFARRRWLTAMMVLVLAAGIGVNTTVFTLFNAVLIRGLPFPEGDRILFVESTNLMENRPRMGVSSPDLADWRGHACVCGPGRRL